MGEVMFHLYRWILSPLAEGLLRLGGLIGDAKWKEFLRDKNRRTFKFNGQWTESSLRAARPIWFHAASGEVEYARSVIREWHHRHPSIPILVTFTSPSAKKLLQGLEGVAAWGPAPWERLSAVRQFLQRFEPRAGLFARTDVWPMLAAGLRERNLPSLLFSATIAEKSTRLKGPARPLTAHTLSQLSAIYLVSEADQATLTGLELKTPTKVAGDTRYDQVAHRLRHPKTMTTEVIADQRPILVAGSTWPEDEAVLLAALRELPDWRLLIAPHEVSRVKEVSDALEVALERPHRYTSGGRWTSRVLLVDTVGILAECYPHGRAALVGGSFRKLVHSVMEPVAAGCVVFVGPFHRNNREAIELQDVHVDGRPLVSCLHSFQEMKEALQNLAKAAPARASIQAEIQRRSGASDAVVAWLERETRVSN